MKKGILISGVCLALSAYSVDSQATTVVFNDFATTSGLTLNGNTNHTFTPQDGNVLRLTQASPNQSGSAFSTTTLNASSFSTFFKFRITNPGGTLFDGNTDTGADGITFVVQSVSSSIGGLGQGIGYAGIGSSVGVEFDTWQNPYNNDPGSNHLGIDINGNVNHGSGSPNTLPISTRFDDGNIWYGWVDYNGSILEVRTNQTGVRPDAASLSRTLDLNSILGVTNAYVGFTSGTGADWGNHDILSWEYRDSYNPVNSPVPEPSTMFLLGGGLAGLAFWRRKKTV
ncbi:MAG: L-type lectin-domain containing protein [Desulfuromonadaceae bacterium]|nr:L-type lectin-domain containing protein [Desulfuromonadaceae bacterium]MDD5106300.1 L-type lectin-domain containing protein [Desulfuromonadaceae bacterium]